MNPYELLKDASARLKALSRSLGGTNTDPMEGSYNGRPVVGWCVNNVSFDEYCRHVARKSGVKPTIKGKDARFAFGPGTFLVETADDGSLLCRLGPSQMT